MPLSSKTNANLVAVRECTHHHTLLQCVTEELAYFNSKWVQDNPRLWTDEDKHAHKVLTRLDRLLRTV